MSGEKIGNSEESVPTIKGELGEWSEGIDLEKRMPKPFDIDLKDFFDRDELELVSSGKSESEIAELEKINHEAFLHNNAEFEKLNERILQIAELGPDEIDALYHDKNTSDSDKSIIVCIEVSRMSDEEYDACYAEEPELLGNISKVAGSIYGFGIAFSRSKLERDDAPFRIMTEREREVTKPGSVEDIASAALESYVMNPNYDNYRISDYSEYLHGIMLDCTKRTIDDKDGTIAEEIDLEKFQERVIESMSWAVLDAFSVQKDYTAAEYDELQKRAVKMFADYNTGHHYITDEEYYVGQVSVVDGNNNRRMGSIYAYEQDDFWDNYMKSVRSNNDEVFRYSSEVARAEMEPWADKIDLEYLEFINDDDSLDCEEKYRRITAYIQGVFEVENLDENGQSRPISVRWFRFEESKVKKLIKKVLGISEENEDLPEAYAGGYYSDSEKSIYYIKPEQSKTKLSLAEIDTVVHEMWHAKQFELMRVQPGTRVSTDDIKVRMYEKNSSAYNVLERRLMEKGNEAYYMQVLEREAYAIGSIIQERLDRRRNKTLGEKILSLFNFK